MKKFNKTVFTAFIVIILSTVCIFTAAAETGTATISSVNAKAGETVQLKLAINDNPGLNYLKVKFGYNSSVMKIESVENKNLLGGASYTGGQNYKLNPYVLTWSAAGNTTESGIIAVVTMKINDDAISGDYPVTLEISDCWNENDDNVSITAVNGVVTISDNSGEKPHEHSYEKEVIPAKCDEDGKEIYRCSCGDTYSEVIPALGHSESDWIIVTPASCSKEGKREKHCTVCNALIVSESIAKTQHKAGDWVVTEEPKIGVEGKKVIYCLNCNKALNTETIPALIDSDKKPIKDDCDGNGSANVSNNSGNSSGKGNGSDSKTTAPNSDVPKTGDAGIAVFAGLAVAAGASIVLTRKRKVFE